MDNIVFDTEGDGFYFETTKLWTIHASNMTTRKRIVIHPFEDSGAKEKFLNFIFRNGKPRIIGHNILGHDMLVLRKLLGIDFSVGKDTVDSRDVEFVDTFFMSMFLNPDRAGHSIGYFGEELGLNKIDYRQALIDNGAMTKEHPEGHEFSFYHELMDEYCLRDTEVTWKVFTMLMNEWEDVYGKDFDNPDYYRCGQKTFFLMTCQELTGWKFDIERAKSLHSEISGMMENIRAEVEPQLPPRPLKKSEESQYRMPAKPYKADGTFSSTMLKFIEKHNAEVLGDGKIKCYGKEYDIVSHGMLDVTKPMEMANQDQLKDYFLSLGWKPSFYNFKRDEFNKPYRDPITKKVVLTTPKIQEQGNICPNLLSMETGIVRQIVKWLSLRNRQSILEGWLSNPRLAMDGRLGGGRRGLAASFRQKHSTITNVPKAQDGVLLGKEFRELFTSEDGMMIAAGDASALEARVQGHYTARFDGGETARELLETDVHSKTAKALFPDKLGDADIYSPDFNKEDPEFKQCRNKAKTIRYAVLYGCGAGKVASVMGVPENQGGEVLERFWSANKATKDLRDSVEEYWEVHGKKFLPAVDGRKLITRKKNALLNVLFQSCGAIAMDYAGCYMDSWLGGIKWDENDKPYYSYKGYIVRRVIYMHDEYQYECSEEIAEEVSRMIEKAIEKAGETLKLKIPLAGEGKVGKNWKETH